MQIQIYTKNLELTKEVKNYLEEKIGGLEKFMEHVDTSIDVKAELSRITRHHQSGDIYRCEVNMFFPHQLIRSEAERDNLLLAIDEVKDELQLEIKKYKQRYRTKYLRGARVLKKLLKLNPLAWVFKKGKRERQE